MFGLLDTPSTINFKPDAFATQQRMQASAPNQAPSSRGQQLPSAFGADQEGSPVGAQSRTKTPISEMTPIDRWGLKGLLETIRSDDPNVSSLAIGQDLTSLGLDLNSQESVSLHQTRTLLSC